MVAATERTAGGMASGSSVKPTAESPRSLTTVRGSTAALS